jgi:hypothetical protein
MYELERLQFDVVDVFCCGCIGRLLGGFSVVQLVARLSRTCSWMILVLWLCLRFATRGMFTDWCWSFYWLLLGCMFGFRFVFHGHSLAAAALMCVGLFACLSLLIWLMCFNALLVAEYLYVESLSAVCLFCACPSTSYIDPNCIASYSHVWACQVLRSTDSSPS